jgi:tRNA dimethylallyltransferase
MSESANNAAEGEEAILKDAPLLVVVLGPTGSGKSALAVRLAERGFLLGGGEGSGGGGDGRSGSRMQGEVVSCDSVAVYREMEIGTAKPSAEDRARVRHYMVDVASPAEEFSAGEYARGARAAIAEISARGKVPIVAGGTGLYLRALLEGLFAGPAASEELRVRLRETAARRGVEYVHRLLRKLDGEAAERIHANDLAKVVRAIEVCVAAGRPLTEAWTDGREGLRGYRVVKFGLAPQREKLYERLNRRAASMFERGLVEETRGLVAKYGAECRALGSLGYKQAQAVLRGEMSEPEAVAATAQGHRNLAKRQGTWFRREAGVEWLRGFGEDVEPWSRD